MPSLQGRSIFRSGIEPAIFEPSSTKQQPKDKYEQVSVKQIISKPYHSTSTIAYPAGGNSEGLQPSKNKGKVAEARPTLQALTKNKKSHDVDEHMSVVAEQV